MKRRAALVLVMVLTLHGGLLGSRAFAQGEHFPGAVSMTVDYPAKRITISVKIDFYHADDTLPLKPTIDRIVGAITAAWNGRKFKCFDVVVKVDARRVKRKSEVRQDAVDVAIDNHHWTARSHVSGTAGDSVVSDDPAGRLRPGRSSDDAPGTKWALFTDSNVYVHEFGHVLGLHDSYIEGQSDPAPGARRDAMFHQKLPISGEMITRIVRRLNDKGQLDESKVKCPITMDAGPASVFLFFASLENMTIHAYACDYDPPSDDPKRKAKPIEWTGTTSYGGTFDTVILGSASGSVSLPMTFQAEGDVPFDYTVTSSTGSVRFGGIYEWGANGLPVSSEPVRIEDVPSTSLGLGMYLRFKEGASECVP